METRSLEALIDNVQKEWSRMGPSIRELQALGPLGEGNTSTGLAPRLVRDAAYFYSAVLDLSTATNEVLKPYLDQFGEIIELRHGKR